MAKFKVLYIISDKNFGGGSRHLFDLINGLDKKIFQSVVISIPSPIIDKLKNKIKIYSLAMKSRLDLPAIKKIREIIIKEKPDIIHLHSTRAGIQGTMAAKNLNIPIIYTEHLFTKDYLPQNKIIHYFQLKALKGLSKNISKVIAVSQAVKDYLIAKNLFAENKIEVIYNGIKANRKPQVVNRKSQKQITIGSIGTLTELKGYQYLVKAVQNLENIKVQIIGHGPSEKKLKHLVKKLNLQKNIKFIKSVKDINKSMTSFDIYIQPSLSESFGLSLAQAMSSAIPVIASKVGGIPKLVGKTGLLIAPKDSKALASAIIKLTGNCQLRKKLAQAGQKRIEKYFSLEKMIKKTEKLYGKIIKLRS